MHGALLKKARYGFGIRYHSKHYFEKGERGIIAKENATRTASDTLRHGYNDPLNHWLKRGKSNAERRHLQNSWWEIISGKLTSGQLGTRAGGAWGVDLFMMCLIYSRGCWSIPEVVDVSLGLLIYSWTCWCSPDDADVFLQLLISSTYDYYSWNCCPMLGVVGMFLGLARCC